MPLKWAVLFQMIAFEVIASDVEYQNPVFTLKAALGQVWCLMKTVTPQDDTISSSTSFPIPPTRDIKS